MDCFVVNEKKSNQHEKGLIGLTEKVRSFQEEIKAIMYEREKESRAYERDMMLFAFKEAEWKQERKKLKEEVKRLRNVVEEKDERIRIIELDQGPVPVDEKGGKKSQFSGTSSLILVEQMREEWVRRDEAVDKWKKLYLAIKTELDDLIQKTHRDGLYWKAEEEEVIEELKMEVKAREGTIEELKARLALMEHQECDRAREVDILRQSLKIMSSRKASNSSIALSKPKSALVKQSRKPGHCK